MMVLLQSEQVDVMGCQGEGACGGGELSCESGMLYFARS